MTIPWQDLTPDSAGLVPAVIQDREGLVRMVGWMNEEALDRTLKTGFVTFWSRSRQELWVKGETSGNSLHVLSVALDCDNDTLLVTVDADGPTCHTGSESCFGAEPSRFGFLEVLQKAATPFFIV